MARLLKSNRLTALFTVTSKPTSGSGYERFFPFPEWE